MTVQDFYATIGGDYDATIKTLKTDERIVKYVKLSAEDETYPNLERSLAEGNIADAFLAAHSLKGVCLNLGYTRLMTSASALTENIRDGILKDNTMDLFEVVKTDYLQIMEAIKELP
ncbi:MAG: Hpt domain-containing protein [Treponemataceae bacterium]|nr:Hpt domain-containing protein [Treponemataceae bacterium]